MGSKYRILQLRQIGTHRVHLRGYPAGLVGPVLENNFLPLLSRKLKTHSGARNRFQEPSLQPSSQAT